jgi:hypothetical protein
VPMCGLTEAAGRNGKRRRAALRSGEDGGQTAVPGPVRAAATGGEGGSARAAVEQRVRRLSGFIVRSDCCLPCN